MRYDRKSPDSGSLTGLHIQTNHDQVICLNYSSRDERHSLNDSLNVTPDLQHLSHSEAGGVLLWVHRNILRALAAKEKDEGTFTRELSRAIDYLDEVDHG